MSWREILGVTEESLTQYTHNTQNPSQKSNSVNSVNSVYGNSEIEFKLMGEISAVCQQGNIVPIELREALSPIDIEDWRNGLISKDTLAAFAKSLEQRKSMDQGKRPKHYTKKATCKHCGPVWLWFSGEVLGCPWCWNRAAGRPIPRP